MPNGLPADFDRWLTTPPDEYEDDEDYDEYEDGPDYDGEYDYADMMMDCKGDR